MLDLAGSVVLSYLAILLVAFPIHELAHALSADLLGDSTPRENGRLTLNPFAHLDFLGTILMLLVGFGWAKPVPINPAVLRARSRSAVMWVSIAGPGSNLLMAILAAIPFRLGWISLSQARTGMLLADRHLLPTLPQFMWIFLSVNLLLFLFNLLPIAPLDGEKIASYLFPPPYARLLESVQPYGPLLLAVLFIAPQMGFDVLGWLLIGPLNFLRTFLVG